MNQNVSILIMFIAISLGLISAESKVPVVLQNSGIQSNNFNMIKFEKDDIENPYVSYSQSQRTYSRASNH